LQFEPHTRWRADERRNLAVHQRIRPDVGDRDVRAGQGNLPEQGVTVGHLAMLHGCTVGDGSLIGVQAVALNGAVIGKQCLVGAGAVVTEGKVYPDRSLILGAPAKRVRELTDEDLARLNEGADDYVRKGAQYRKQLETLSR